MHAFVIKHLGRKFYLAQICSEHCPPVDESMLYYYYVCVCACEQYRSVLGKVTCVCVYSGCAAVRFIVKRAKPVCARRCEKDSLTEFLDRKFNCIASAAEAKGIITLCCTSGERTLSQRPAACVRHTGGELMQSAKK